MAKVFNKNKQNSSSSLISKSIFDDGKSFLFEKCTTSLDPSLIICQEVFFKKSNKKKEKQKLISFFLTDEFILFPKVFFSFSINKLTDVAGEKK